MKILFVCQYYDPEPFCHPDICEELVRRGHEVTVVTGLPNYPMGNIYEGYRKGEKRNEVIRGVRVHRCFTIGRRHGILFRFLNYYSYALSSSHYVRKLKEDFDVVLVHQLSPVMMADAGIRYKKKHGGPMILYSLDLWPACLSVGGVGPGNPIYRYYHHVSEKIYRQADRILVTSRMFSDYFQQEFGIADTEYLPQYAEDLFDAEQCRKEPDDTIDLMFAGNIGAAQSVETILNAARLTRDIPNLRWHIVGDGSELKAMQSKSADLPSVIFHGRKAMEEMPRYYAMADAMLMTMGKDPFLSMTLPGKIQSYMAAGKPIIGAADGETAAVIREAECGFCGPAEDAQTLAENVRAFIARKDTRDFSENAKAFYNRHFKKEVFMEKLESELESAVR